MPPREQSLEVLVADDDLTIVAADDLQELTTRLPRSARNRVRLCAHRSSDDPLHEMLIVLGEGSYIRPHRHRGKAESFHLIDGRVDVVFFDEQGTVAQLVEMGTYGSGLPFYYRIAEATYHTLIVRSPRLLYHEVTGGPFRREDTEFAPWSPDDREAEACAAWTRTLEASLHRVREARDGR